MLRPFAAVSLGVVLALLAPPASPSVVTSMDEATLVRLSTVIVRGEVESMASVEDSKGNIDTWVSIRISEGLKGVRGRDRVAVSVPGGTVRGRASFVFGAPRFQVGEKVLVFATPTRAGDLTVTGLFQGKLRIAPGPEGEEGVPEEGNGARLVGSRPPIAAQRLEPLLERVRGLVRGQPDLRLSERVRADMPAGADIVVTPNFSLLPILPFRYFGPDNGVPVSFQINPGGSPVTPAATLAGFAASRQGWTDVAGASIVVADGGITSLACRTFFDGSVISHGDPCGQSPPFDPVSCSGVLAFSGVSGFTLSSKVVNGVSFLEMTEADTVFNANTECFYAGADAARNYEEVLAHEMGHGLGMGHSCDDDFTPPCVPGTEADDALMRAFAHGGGRGGTPRADDVDGIRFIYPTPGFIDLQLSAESFSTGQNLSLKADLNGTVAADLYFLFVLPSGVFVSLAPGLPVNTIVPTATNVTLAFARDIPIVSFTWSGTEPAGTYAFVALLTRAGTDVTNPANRVGSDFVIFTFTP